MGSIFRDLGPYYGPFDEVGSLKGPYFAEKVPKLPKLGKLTINFLQTFPQSNGLIRGIIN